MAHRDLTTEEKNILGHVVIDPDAWWVHCENVFKGDPEEALSAKVSKWKKSYEDAVAAGGYKARKDRPDQSAAPGA